jgi:hypothetical protein
LAEDVSGEIRGGDGVVRRYEDEGDDVLEVYRDKLPEVGDTRQEMRRQKRRRLLIQIKRDR